MILNTDRLILSPISDTQLKDLINTEPDAALKQAYAEMLQGCTENPEARIWYTPWYMELKHAPHTVIGNLGFKGLDESGTVELGYGLKDGYGGRGYMTEAVRAITRWAILQPQVLRIEAETAPENTASQNVLRRAGYIETGACGEEGPRFVYRAIKTPRLLLRPWDDGDADDLFRYARDPAVGPIAGWPPHQSRDESLHIIRNVLSGKEAYAVCLKGDGKAIGAAELMLSDHSHYAKSNDECELGYWLGTPFRGRGIIPEAAEALLRRAFEELGMKKVWCGYYEGNSKSKRVQEKLGFRHQQTNTGVNVPLLHETRTEHVNCLTKEDWSKQGAYTMNQKDYIIRPERTADHRAVEALVRDSFWNVYRPGCSEHYVIHVLRDDPDFVKELDFVMEQDGRLIGQNMFMKTVIHADDGRVINVLTMGPICIAPDLKRKGYGKKLLDHSLKQAAALGYGAVLFEGNIAFYGKSGFDYASSFGIRYHDLPEGADASFFLCKELIPGYLDGVTGVYQTPQGYYVDDADVEAFDNAFPPREKQKLPGQIFG